MTAPFNAKLRRSPR